MLAAIDSCFSLFRPHLRDIASKQAKTRGGKLEAPVRNIYDLYTYIQYRVYKDFAWSRNSGHFLKYSTFWHYFCYRPVDLWRKCCRYLVLSICMLKIIFVRIWWDIQKTLNLIRIICFCWHNFPGNLNLKCFLRIYV